MEREEDGLEIKEREIATTAVGEKKKKKSLAGFFFLSFPAKATAFVVCDQNLKEKKREREREMHRPRPVTPFCRKKSVVYKLRTVEECQWKKKSFEPSGIQCVLRDVYCIV